MPIGNRLPIGIGISSSGSNANPIGTEYEYVAGEDISAGDFVKLTKYTDEITVKTTEDLDCITSNNKQTLQVDTNIILLYATDKTNVQIMRINDDKSVTVGDKFTFTSNSVSNVTAIKIDTTRVMICYSDTTNNKYGMSVILNIDDTNITFGNTFAFVSDDIGYIAPVLVDTNKILVCYTKGIDSDPDIYVLPGYALILSVNGSTISAVGDPCYFTDNLMSGEATLFTPVLISTNKVLVCYRDDWNGYHGAANLLTISDTTISVSERVIIGTSSTSFSYRSVFKINDDNVLAFYSLNSTNHYVSRIHIENNAIYNKEEHHLLSSPLSAWKVIYLALVGEKSDKVLFYFSTENSSKYDIYAQLISFSNDNDELIIGPKHIIDSVDHIGNPLFVQLSCNKVLTNYSETSSDPRITRIINIIDDKIVVEKKYNDVLLSGLLLQISNNTIVCWYSSYKVSILTIDSNIDLRVYKSENSYVAEGIAFSQAVAGESCKVYIANTPEVLLGSYIVIDNVIEKDYIKFEYDITSDNIVAYKVENIYEADGYIKSTYSAGTTAEVYSIPSFIHRISSEQKELYTVIGDNISAGDFIKIIPGSTFKISKAKKSSEIDGIALTYGEEGDKIEISTL